MSALEDWKDRTPEKSPILDVDEEGNLEDEEEVCWDQWYEPSVERRRAYPALSIKVVEVNKFIVQIKAKEIDIESWTEFPKLFFEGRLELDCALEDKVKQGGYDPFSKNKYVIASVTDEDGWEDSSYFRGVVLSWNPENLFYQVFLVDVGVVRKLTPFEMASVRADNERFFSIPPSFIFVTIPGIVPRKRLENIPGLAELNRQDTQWNQGAGEDVQQWLVKYPIKLVHKIKEEGLGLWFGDFLGAEGTELVADDWMSRHLVEKKNVFMNLKTLNLT